MREKPNRKIISQKSNLIFWFCFSDIYRLSINEYLVIARKFMNILWNDDGSKIEI